MGEYFKPLRRKLAVSLLVIACVFAAGWVRSLNNIEGIVWQAVQSAVMVISVDRHLGLLLVRDDSMTPSYPTWVTDNFQTLESFIDEGNRPSWHWHCLGFHMATATTDPSQSVFFMCCPYWSALIPLTLLSAWLLLSKLRQPIKPEPSPESAA